MNAPSHSNSMASAQPQDTHIVDNNFSSTENEKDNSQSTPGETSFIYPQPKNASLTLQEAGKYPVDPPFVKQVFFPSEFLKIRINVVIFSLSVAIWLVCRLGGGILSVILVTMICADYWDRLRVKLYSQVRIEAEYYASRRRLQLGAEEADWLNNILRGFWLVYEPSLSRSIQEALDPILEWICPSFIDSMKFEHFTLGTFPPQIRSIVTARDNPDDIIDLQMDVILGTINELTLPVAVEMPDSGELGPTVPEDRQKEANSQVNSHEVPGRSGEYSTVANVSTSSDLPGQTASSEAPSPSNFFNQVEGKSNSRIDLVIRMKALPILIRAEHLQFEGQIRVRMKLTTTFPHIKILEIWLTDVPRVDFSLRPLGALDLKAVRTVHNKLNESIAWALREYLVYPHPLVLPLGDWFDGPTEDLHTSHGVLILHISNASGLKNTDIIGKSDPFARILVNNTLVSRTAVIMNNLNPYWDETKYIPVSNPADIQLRVEICDYDKAFANKLLGYADIDLGAIDQGKGGTIPMQEYQLYDSDRRPRGKLRMSAGYSPVLAPPLDSVSSDVPTSASGLLRVTIHAAKGLETGTKSRSPYVNVALNGEQVHRTRVKKHSNAPLWEESFEVFVADCKTAKLHLNVREESITKLVSNVDVNLGEATISVSQALKKDSKDDWYPLAQTNSRDAKLRMTVKWRPVALSELDKLSSGVLRIRVLSCSDLKSPNAATKCNPYVRLLASGKVRAQTRQLSDNVNPQFDETIFSLIKDVNEAVTLQVWDHGRAFKDSVIGSVSIDLNRYMQSDGVQAECPDSKFGNRAALEFEEMDLMHVDHTKQRGRILLNVTYHAKSPSMTFSPESPNVCGVLRVNVHQMKNLPRKANVYFELSGDDPTLCIFKSTTRKRSMDPIFEQSCEIFVRQVYWSTFHLTLREDKDAGGGTPEVPGTGKIQLNSGTASGPMGRSGGAGMGSSLTLGKSHPIIASFDAYVFDLYNKSDEKWYELTNGVRAKLSFNFTPIDCLIDASESLSNMGLLHLEIVCARNLPAMDRNGKCDPFVVVYVNDERWHRTATLKKNLNPVWKERVVLPVINRNRSILRFELFDWDRVSENELVGSVELNLAEISTDSQTTVELPLSESTRSFIVVSYRFDAQRIDKIPSRALTFTKATLDRLDPRRMLNGTRFSFNSSANILPSPSTPPGKDTQNGSEGYKTTRGLDGSENDAAIAGSSFLDNQPSEIALSRANSADFGSNSSLCSYCNDHADKVRERGAIAITIVEAVDLLAVDKNGTSDPYVTLRCNPRSSTGVLGGNRKNKYCSRTIPNVTHAVWNETFSTTFPRGALSGNDALDPFFVQFTVWDANRIQNDIEIGSFQFNVWDVVCERLRNNSVTTDPFGIGWLYVRHDLWLKLKVNHEALSLSARVAANHNLDTIGSSTPKRIPQLHVHVSLLLPPSFDTKLLLHHTFPSDIESGVDNYWVDQVVFPIGIVSPAINDNLALAVGNSSMLPRHRSASIGSESSLSTALPRSGARFSGGIKRALNLH